MEKIKSEGHQAFNVPNTPDGKKFLEMAKQYKNNRVLIINKGRIIGKRGTTSIGKSDFVLMYITGSPVIYYLKQHEKLYEEAEIANGLLKETIVDLKKVLKEQVATQRNLLLKNSNLEQKLIVEYKHNRNLNGLVTAYKIKFAELAKLNWWQRIFADFNISVEPKE